MSHHDEITQTIIRNSNMVYRLAYSQMKNKTDADDIYQEVFGKSLALTAQSMKKLGL